MLALENANLAPFVTPERIASQRARLALAREQLLSGTGAGAEFRGWLDPAAMVPDAQLGEILRLASELRDKTDTLVSVGIGGSYLGTRAVLEALGGDRVVEFAGQSLSARAHSELLARLAGRRVGVNAISKSGTTTEPAVAFRLVRSLAVPGGIVATTDPSQGALRALASEEGWPTLPIAPDVGGRFSVLSPVGLLPLAYAGVDIRALRAGAIEAATRLHAEVDPLKNPALFYAAARNLLYGQGFAIEALSAFEPRLHYLLEWWKQLFGESEGKDGAALYPSSAMFTTDLHSLGQWFQEGRRILCETFLVIESGEPELSLPGGSARDELEYLTGEPLTAINAAAHGATAIAHRDGGVPNLTIRLGRLDARHLGGLLYFFEWSCAISGYLLGVNPFDQPGVEAYKVNMFGLLGKPGYESVGERLRGELEQMRSQFPPVSL